MTKTASILWYSQTGHSYTCGLKARDVLEAGGWKVTMVPLKNAGPEHYEADALVYAFPVHSFQIPVAVNKYLLGMKALVSPKSAFVILTYAGAAVNTDCMIRKMLAKKNIRLINYTLIRCRDSYIPFIKWIPFLNDKSKPDAASFQAVERFVREKILNEQRERRPIFNPLNPLHWIGAMSPPNGPKWFLGKRIYREEACVKCGICASLCPSGAITMRDKTIHYTDGLCIGCCGCMNACPSNAWVSSRFDPSVYNKGMHVRDMADAMTKGQGQGKN